MIRLLVSGHAGGYRREPASSNRLLSIFILKPVGWLRSRAVDAVTGPEILRENLAASVGRVRHQSAGLCVRGPSHQISMSGNRSRIFDVIRRMAEPGITICGAKEVSTLPGKNGWLNTPVDATSHRRLVQNVSGVPHYVRLREHIFIINTSFTLIT